MKTIIIATDFSAEADNAMLYAATAASEGKYEVILFTLQNVSIHALNSRISPEGLDQLIKKYQEKLNIVAAKLAADYRIKVTPHFAMGDFYEELPKCYEIHNADLVVLGMAQKSFEQDLLGNTTTQSLHRLKFPIMAIPLSATYKGIKNILFACDIVRGVHKQILENVKSISTDFGANVEIFHVSNKIAALKQEEITSLHLEEIKEEFKGISYQYKNVQSNEILKAIKSEMEMIQADLLIMIPYRYGFWASLIHKSRTRVMASNNNIPLLSLPL